MRGTSWLPAGSTRDAALHISNAQIIATSESFGCVVIVLMIWSAKLLPYAERLSSLVKLQRKTAYLPAHKSPRKTNRI